MNSIKYTSNNSTAYTLFNRVASELAKFDKNLFNLLENYTEDLAVAGGAIRSILSKTSIQDVDLYISDLEILPEITEYLTEYGYEVVHSSDNALTFKQVEGYKTIQLIKKVLLDVQDPTSLFDEFDFTVTHALFFADTLYLGETFLEDLASHSLILKNKHLKYPIATLVRTLKYQRYGFKASPLLMVNIALQIHALDISTYAHLKEQLQGIDTMIFDAMLSKIDNQLVFSVPDILTHISDNYFNYLEN